MGAPAKFIRKAKACDAIQWDGSADCTLAIIKFAKGSVEPDGDVLMVFTAEGVSSAKPTDWIVFDEAGPWVCSNEAFRNSYEAV